jgi:hypothetical protein
MRRKEAQLDAGLPTKFIVIEGAFMNAANSQATLRSEKKI